MKRLKLDDFKSKNLKKENQTTTDKLLGQVLGDCHDHIHTREGSAKASIQNIR
ncbi:hypothetical protein [Aureispira anguillae]|uniref:Uncharacterized protein n=1 Tax=Aureispira anguillae TaxID=2864201 RepID=A0A915YI69_9BACT|nr:hypothetical protein [Aureispira anguillae]BDS13648.1 hypothetical protein AsAng_0043870 [Aureispira anguillae]